MDNPKRVAEKLLLKMVDPWGVNVDRLSMQWSSASLLNQQADQAREGNASLGQRASGLLNSTRTHSWGDSTLRGAIPNCSSECYRSRSHNKSFFSLLLLTDVIDLEPGILRSCSSSSSGVGCSPWGFRVQAWLPLLLGFSILGSRSRFDLKFLKNLKMDRTSQYSTTCSCLQLILLVGDFFFCRIWWGGHTWSSWVLDRPVSERRSERPNWQIRRIARESLQVCNGSSGSSGQRNRFITIGHTNLPFCRLRRCHRLRSRSSGSAIRHQSEQVQSAVHALCGAENESRGGDRDGPEFMADQEGVQEQFLSGWGLHHGGWKRSYSLWESG